MYEQMKNQLVMTLTEQFNPEEISFIIEQLNIIAYDYDITRKETSLVIYEGDAMPQLVQTYLVCKRMEGIAEATLYNYGHHLKMFFNSIQKQPHEVTSNDIRVFLYRYQAERGISNRTLDKYRTYISSFYQWAVDEEYMERNPSRSVKPIKFEVKPRQALDQIELEYLRQACETVREQAMIEFLYSTGCRISELSNVKLEDVDWKEKKVMLFGKGRKYRTSYLNAKAEVTLKRYLETRTDDSEWLFVSCRKPYGQLRKAGLERIVREINERAQGNIGKNVTPHVLRHTTATIALGNGMPVEDISKLLGHSNISTTMIYAHTSLENVQKGHKKCIV